MSIITWFDVHQGFLSSLFSFLTFYIAVKALNKWKQELKAKKLYELHYKAYTQLNNLKNELDSWTSFYKDMDEAYNPDIFNSKMADYFKQNLNAMEELALNLSQINEKDNTIQYFTKIFKTYSVRESELYYGQLQSRINPQTGEIEEYDPFCKNFSEDYFFTNDQGQFDGMHVEINSRIDAGIKYFDEQIKKFFK